MTVPTPSPELTTDLELTINPEPTADLEVTTDPESTYSFKFTGDTESTSDVCLENTQALNCLLTCKQTASVLGGGVRPQLITVQFTQRASERGLCKYHCRSSQQLVTGAPDETSPACREAASLPRCLFKVMQTPLPWPPCHAASEQAHLT